eukprot:TRINITY_DN4112_c0_g1_i8.p1 TRINITY_DN4112_c0_g1~~TRINITY_DN4112_c0_g1_i8.p1  ORF type:complete len:315 (-),score=62.82 TRINITY_DN4112_c0_g1_i8:31-975(-)
MSSGPVRRTAVKSRPGRPPSAKRSARSASRGRRASWSPPGEEVVLRESCGSEAPASKADIAAAGRAADSALAETGVISGASDAEWHASEADKREAKEALARRSWHCCCNQHKDHNGLVAQKDFAEACRSLGATKTTAIWKEIDRKNLGHVTLAMLDPETAECYAEFHDLLMEAASHSRQVQSPDATAVGPRRPNLKDAWQRAFDPKKIRRVERPMFVEGCKEIGYSQDPERLFDLLRPDPYREYLVFTDIVDDLNPNSYQTKPGLRDALLPIKKKKEKVFDHDDTHIGTMELTLRETLLRSQASSQSPAASMLN